MNRGGLDHVEWPPQPRPIVFSPMTLLPYGWRIFSVFSQESKTSENIGGNLTCWTPYLSYVKYFWPSENLILPPLLFSNVFPGYRGLQYIQYFFVVPVISLFFTCKKSKFSRPGLQMNLHANFTYSFPQINIILIPTVIRSIHFSFIALIAGAGSPIPDILLLCDIDLLYIFINNWNFINKAYCCF